MKSLPYIKQLTKEQAIAFCGSNEWKNWSHREIAAFQLTQERLCVPFSVFHEAVEKALERPVWTHEFALNHNGLVDELLGAAKAPTLKEIISLIPKDKQSIIVIE